MTSPGESDETTARTTFKDAYGVLQRHAETLRRQQEPNIDELVNIVTESVNAYRICKERIQAVEQALERTLGEADVAGGDAPVGNSAARDGASGEAQSSSKDSETSEFNDDIPF